MADWLLYNGAHYGTPVYLRHLKRRDFLDSGSVPLKE